MLRRNGTPNELLSLQAGALRMFFSALSRTRACYGYFPAPLRSAPHGEIVATGYRLLADEMRWKRIPEHVVVSAEDLEHLEDMRREFWTLFRQNLPRFALPSRDQGKYARESFMEGIRLFLALDELIAEASREKARAKEKTL